MRRVASYALLMLFGLILVHSIIPHDHGEGALSDHPTLTSKTVTHNLLFLEIDLGEDHLEDYDQSNYDFVFIAEDEIVCSFKSECGLVIHKDDVLPIFINPVTQPNRGPPVV